MRSVCSPSLLRLLTALVMSATMLGCSPSPDPRHVRPSSTESQVASKPPTLQASPSTPLPTPPIAVGFRRVTVINTAAGTPARGPSPARGDRVLPTSIWFPARGTGASTALPGPYPLVVFAHGFNTTPALYAPLLRELAAAGYVVAAPEFPISASGLPGAPREDDLHNQPLDIRATISAMLDLDSRPGWLSRRLLRREIAVIGHSDGGETVAGNLLVAPDHDRRIRAAVVLAGQLPTWGQFEPAHVPTLVVQGSADTINPPALSHSLYARLAAPKWYLDVIGATHLQTAVGSGLAARTGRHAILAFLAAMLRHDTHALVQLRRLGDEPGVTRLSYR